jgi:hypothetical protein
LLLARSYHGRAVAAAVVAAAEFAARADAAALADAAATTSAMAARLAADAWDGPFAGLAEAAAGADPAAGGLGAVLIAALAVPIRSGLVRASAVRCGCAALWPLRAVGVAWPDAFIEVAGPRA